MHDCLNLIALKAGRQGPGWVQEPGLLVTCGSTGHHHAGCGSVFGVVELSLSLSLCLYERKLAFQRSVHRKVILTEVEIWRGGFSLGLGRGGEGRGGEGRGVECPYRGCCF
ncbi:hypothetical protein KC19_2G007800 [Ceratodon purpureus]|uniref:Uncharacterized protein n=1 Tax=Ceratodon purpureus TaxID=3225 RepID=A0A8T0IQC5_CERPU|nr:hypothetical protein KC19_2G007800 [Ceratodon purpureus]